MSIKNLIAKAKVKEAIQILIDSNIEIASTLMGRFNEIGNKRMSGTISSQDYTLERNKIVADVLECATKNKEKINTSEKDRLAIKEVGYKQRLEKIIKDNIRRRPKIAKEANSLLLLIRAWEDKKRIKPTFDPIGRRLKNYEEKADKLFKKLADKKGKSLEEIIDRIALLLEPTVPSYSALSEAYELAVGRGFKDSYIEMNLENRPDDDEVIFDIVERIEDFTLSIKLK